MQTKPLKTLFLVILAILAIGYAIIMFQGIQDYAKQSFTPEQVLAGKVPAHIPVWVEGQLENLKTEQGENKLSIFQVSQGQHSIFVFSINALPANLNTGAQVAALVMQPKHQSQCVPDTANCRLELRGITMAGSLMKFFLMGSYGFFVWISYALAAIILLFNFIQPRVQEREVKRAIARKARRRNT